jgi:hypothetical protein
MDAVEARGLSLRNKIEILAAIAPDDFGHMYMMSASLDELDAAIFLGVLNSITVAMCTCVSLQFCSRVLFARAPNVFRSNTMQARANLRTTPS